MEDFSSSDKDKGKFRAVTWENFDPNSQAYLSIGECFHIWLEAGF